MRLNRRFSRPHITGYLVYTKTTNTTLNFLFTILDQIHLAPVLLFRSRPKKIFHVLHLIPDVVQQFDDRAAKNLHSILVLQDDLPHRWITLSRRLFLHSSQITPKPISSPLTDPVFFRNSFLSSSTADSRLNFSLNSFPSSSPFAAPGNFATRPS
jgi:hypothetical protein